MDEKFYRRYCDLKVRVAPYRMKDDYETIKTVAAIDALADHAEVLTHGEDVGRFGWNKMNQIETEPLFSLALNLLEAMEEGEEPLRGYFAEPGGALIDHSFVIEDGKIHVFYNRGYIGYDWPERFVDSIGHAVSEDLIHWDIKPPVLTAQKGGHDDYQVWSPGVVEHDGCYWMFYTGVNYNIAQAPCLAKSKDLYHWERSGSSPLFIPGEWCPWSPDKWSDGRDGMVFADDDGTFYMYYCSSCIMEDGSGATAMGIASSRDMYHWKDEGCFRLEECKLSPESPYVIKHNGLYYMFYTNCEKGGTYYATSANPITGWVEKGEALPGVSCSEVFEFKGKWYISGCAHKGGGMHFLVLYEFTWNKDGSVSVSTELYGTK